MKIKITLIAFFASALLLTSCMKNEVSPSIEQIRTAYAAFLNAKAQAELIKANADAQLTIAQAGVQDAIAQMNLATAAGTDAATALALENLAQLIKTNEIALVAAQRADQVLQDAYELAVQTAKDAAVTLYFGNYTAAILVVNGIEANILDKQRQIVMLNLDLVNGTDSALTAAKATLAAAQATLAGLEAELVTAKALLGDPAATKANIAQRYQDSVLLEQELKQLAIDRKNMEADYATEAAAEAAASAAYSAANLAYNNAVLAAKPDSAETAFLADTVMNGNIPEFWKDALRNLFVADSLLTAKAADTLASYTAMTAAQTTIATGLTAVTAAYNVLRDSVIAYVYDIDSIQNDSAVAYAAWVLDTAQLNAAIADTVAADAAQALLVASMASHYAAYNALPYGPARTGDSTVYWDGYADSVYYVSAGEFLDNLAVTAALADTAVTGPIWRAASTAWTTTGASLVAFLGTPSTTVNPAVLYGRRNVAFAAIATQQTAIDNATAALPDLISDYLYHQTFVDDLVADSVAAAAAKEAVRADYNTWKDAYYDDFVAALNATVASKLATKDAKKATWDAKKAALAIVFEPTRLLDSVVAQRGVEKTLLIALRGLYATLETGEDAFLAAFEAAITAAEGAVTAAETTVGVAEWTYATGLVNYDKFQSDLVELNARLVAAQAQVAFWKALLDEALAANN